MSFLHLPDVLHHNRFLHLNTHNLWIYFLNLVGRHVSIIPIILPDVPPVLVGLVEQEHHLALLHVQAMALVRVEGLHLGHLLFFNHPLDLCSLEWFILPNLLITII